MIDVLLLAEHVGTPAFVISRGGLLQAADRIASACREANCCPLYSVKASCISQVVECLDHYVDGFSVCSPFEFRLVRDTLGDDKALHISSPYLGIDVIEPFLRSTDFISFNSLSQFRRQVPRLRNKVSVGLRINPNLSFVSDDRYNPCRRQSKLGVPIEELAATPSSLGFTGLSHAGLHFHSNCESRDFGHLLQTVSLIAERCASILDEVTWINLGGGYLFNAADARDDFIAAVRLLRNRHSLEVFIEPGAAFVREAGYLVSTVVDRFSRDGKLIAVLDTTVNHMPEVFEFQFEPDVLGTSEDGVHRYILAGCSCLAGDLFGEYGFDEALGIGDRVVFENVGDYTTTKWHYFNGINLPSIYMLTEDGELVLVKEFTYEEFAEKNGVVGNVIV
ncbi:hypothetical protein OAS39_07510 [Pirellulales bacterium]|nr:hypothetical protein [Pirellulales bacterium]